MIKINFIKKNRNINIGSKIKVKNTNWIGIIKDISDDSIIIRWKNEIYDRLYTKKVIMQYLEIL